MLTTRYPPQTKGDNGKAADISSPPLDTIDIGDTIPSVVLKNEKDEDVDVATLTEEKGLILFLVPKADTCKWQIRYLLTSIHF